MSSHRIVRVGFAGCWIALGLGVAGCSTARVGGDASAAERLPASDSIVTFGEVAWGALNPARGDKSPRAGTLWGDRTGSGASGFLVKFDEGFSSPPHIHNITYRGVVIQGLVHNDDPGAAGMWMPAGSFWVQPAGEAHITAASGVSNMAYVEIDEGPYLVLPTEESFESAHKPINVERSNLVWLDATSIEWIELDGAAKHGEGAEVAFLWGDPQDDQPSGSFVRLPHGFDGAIRGDGSVFHAVVIQGSPVISSGAPRHGKALEPGSYFGADGGAAHRISVPGSDGCVVYIRTNGSIEVGATER